MVSTAGKQNTAAAGEQNVSDESILKITKEIAVKFIEVGRITPASFPRDFMEIHGAITATVRKNEK